MQKTNIPYLTHSWNPLQDKRKGESGRGYHCTKCSPACDHCWAEAANMRFGNKLPFDNTPVEFEIIEKELAAPQKRKKPAIIGTQFMGDLFHPGIKDHQLNSIWRAMLVADWHTYLVLTKRPGRMLRWVETGVKWRKLDHVWLGVSCENQKAYDERIPILLQIPATVHFVSIEPMLGGIMLYRGFDKENRLRMPWLEKLDWVIAGCESGPGRRHIGLKPFRQLRDQCVSANIPFFLKQIEIDGKVVSRPRLDSKVWAQMPEVK